jgi:hypothetical protein
MRTGPEHSRAAQSELLPALVQAEDRMTHVRFLMRGAGCAIVGMQSAGETACDAPFLDERN